MKTADVAIVGGGILGAVSALELALAGLDVVLFDRRAPNREGSGTTAGNLHIQAIHTRRPGQEIAADNVRFLPLQLAASPRWDTLSATLDDAIELTRNGGFMVAETPEQLRELETKQTAEKQLGLATEIVDGDTARAAMPQLSEKVIAATWCAEDGYANPLLVTPMALRKAKENGARVHGFTPVERILARSNGYEVHTDRETYSVASVVNVAGPWIADVADRSGIRLDLSPVAIQMHVTERLPAGSLPYLVQHIAEGLSVKQVTAGNLLIGGGWPSAAFHPTERAPISMDSVIGNLRQAAAVLPIVARTRLLRAWSGPLAATPDEMPVIGEVPGYPGYIVAGGTYAFTLAPLWAETIRNLIQGTPPPEPIADLGVDRLVIQSETKEIS